MMDTYSVEQIDLAILHSMEELLSKSAGYPTSLQDELDYFIQESPSGWFVACDSQNKKMGFIRSFNQNSEWSLGELYIEPKTLHRTELALALITRFFESHTFPSGHRIRFDFSSNDNELNSAAERIQKKSRKQRFLQFELDADSTQSTLDQDATVLAVANEVAEVLSHLHPLTESEAQHWIEEGGIRFVKSGNRIASAAQVYFYPNSAEINRIATHSDFLRQGFAETLIQQICSEIRAKGIQKLFLKVEDVRLPAINFYRKMGFQEIPEKEQIWHSFYFD